MKFNYGFVTLCLCAFVPNQRYLKFPISLASCISSVLGSLVLFACIVSFVASQENPAHSGLGGEAYNCNICHAGHGVSATPMLNQKFIDLCYYCHSSDTHPPSLTTGRQGMRSHFKSRIPFKVPSSIINAPLPDIRFAFSKRFRHPIETESFHQFNEFLMEIQNLPRHSSCLDCHNPHLASKEKPYAGVTGFDLNGHIVMDSPRESFVCYKCHSEYGNKPLHQKDILALFQLVNPSFHPVEAEGKNSFVPSLMFPYDNTSRISCSDCHNNDEESPSGPHGSVYQFILERNYTATNGIFETEEAYAMCYKCHNRISILNNESFPEHYRHLVTNKISCISCHDSHGSLEYPYLIHFPETIVSPPLIIDVQREILSASPKPMGLPDAISQKEKSMPADEEIFVKPTFIPLGLKHGQCYLFCHGKNHKPATY